MQTHRLLRAPGAHLRLAVGLAQRCHHLQSSPAHDRRRHPIGPKAKVRCARQAVARRGIRPMARCVWNSLSTKWPTQMSARCGAICVSTSTITRPKPFGPLWVTSRCGRISRKCPSCSAKPDFQGSNRFGRDGSDPEWQSFRTKSALLPTAEIALLN
jgi:hypothetical protein